MDAVRDSRVPISYYSRTGSQDAMEDQKVSSLIPVFFGFLSGIEPVPLLPRLLWGGGLDRLAMTPEDDMTVLPGYLGTVLGRLPTSHTW